MWRLALAILLFSFSSKAQTDTSLQNRQIEIAGLGYARSFGLLHLHIAGGVNFPGHKRGWYNNFSITITTQDYTQGGGALTHYTTAAVGKHFELTKKHFFLSVGGNTGLYYSDWASDGYSSRNYGICVYPRIELGWNMKKVVVCTGLQYIVGFGIYRMYYEGEIYYDDPDVGFFDKFRGNGIGSPYVKLILK